jgi:hypothetical protein
VGFFFSGLVKNVVIEAAFAGSIFVKTSLAIFWFGNYSKQSTYVIIINSIVGKT